MSQDGLRMNQFDMWKMGFREQARIMRKIWYYRLRIAG